MLLNPKLYYLCLRVRLILKSSICSSNTAFTREFINCLNFFHRIIFHRSKDCLGTLAFWIENLFDLILQLHCIVNNGFDSLEIRNKFWMIRSLVYRESMLLVTLIFDWVIVHLVWLSSYCISLLMIFCSLNLQFLMTPLLQ